MSGKRDASYGEVTYKVKRAIWLARRFTIAELVNLTEMGRESIESVVQRLVDEGVVKPTGENAGGGGRGRPSQYYDLVDDPIRVAGLVRSIEAFEVNSGQLPPRQPMSVYYLEAVDQLTRIEQARRRPTANEVAELEGKLESARQFEKLLERDLDVALAHLDAVAGRLAAAQGRLREAIKLFEAARTVFERARLTEETQQVRARLLAVEALNARPRVSHSDNPARAGAFGRAHRATEKTARQLGQVRVEKKDALFMIAPGAPAAYVRYEADGVVTVERPQKGRIQGHEPAYTRGSERSRRFAEVDEPSESRARPKQHHQDFHNDVA